MLQLFDAVRRYAAFGGDALLTSRLQDALCFEVTNVAEWCRDTFAQEEKAGVRTPLTDSMRHIPNAAPVAQSMWFEYRPVYKVARRDCTVQGCLSGVYCDLVRYPKSLDMLRAVYARGGQKLPVLPPDMRWLVMSETFMLDPRPSPVPGVPPIWRSDWLFSTAINEAGKIVGFMSMPNPATPKHAPDHATIIEDEHVVSMAALSFLHCKNVTVREHAPPRQIRRAAERDGVPIITYRTLDIAPMTRVLRDEGGIERHGMARALHICRGHFANYTADHPLFGRYVGQFYRPDHVRGNAKVGQVVKDYRIHAGVGQ